VATTCKRPMAQDWPPWWLGGGGASPDRRYRSALRSRSCALDADVPWAVVLRQLPIPITKDTGRRIMRSAAKYRAMPNDAHMLARTNCRQGKWPQLDASLYKWYLAIYSLGHRRIPITTAVLQKAACMIAGRLSITGFTASHGYIRGFSKR